MSRIVLSCFLVLVPMIGTGEVVDDFEGYADTASLEAIWGDSGGTPIQTLSTQVVHSGSQSMEVTYSGSSARLTWYMSVAQDWSDTPFVVLQVRGTATNPAGTLHIGVRSTTVGCSYHAFPVSTSVTTWTSLIVPLGDCVDLTDVVTLDLFLTNTSGTGQITLWVDDFLRSPFSDGFESGSTVNWSAEFP